MFHGNVKKLIFDNTNTVTHLVVSKRWNQSRHIEMTNKKFDSGSCVVTALLAWPQFHTDYTFHFHLMTKIAISKEQEGMKVSG